MKTFVRHCLVLWITWVLLVLRSDAAPVFEPLLGFETGPSQPSESRLYLHTDGNFYGTSTEGAANSDGTVFRITPAGAITTLVHFSSIGGNPAVGRDPVGELVSDGQGWLWGTTSTYNNNGNIFKFNPATGQEVNVYNFTGAPGGVPMGGLVNDGQGFLWGATSSSFTFGAVYKIAIAGGAATAVVQFTGTAGAAPGQFANSSLVSDGNGFFWGVALRGGAADSGVVYKINQATGAYTNVVSFTGATGAAKGLFPHCTLVNDGLGNFWGTTQYGGAADLGTIFKVNIATGTFTSIKEFTGTAGLVKGGQPLGLELDGLGNLWGMTSTGGTGDLGTLFKVSVANGAFTNVRDFTGTTGATKGANPRARLTNDGQGFLWGTTRYGGASNLGTIFKVNRATSAVTTVYELTGGLPGGRPSGPAGGLVQGTNGYLWGVTEIGGVGNAGCVFKYNPETQDLLELASFINSSGAGSNGAVLKASLVDDGQGFFWGTTYQGGLSGAGTIYKIRATTGALTTVLHFTDKTGAAPGSNSSASLAKDGAGYLWGTTRFGGTQDLGTVYKVNIATGAHTVIVQFTGTAGGAKGAEPRCILTNDGAGFMWGVTFKGGVFNSGTIFKCAIGTGAFTNVADFNGNSGETPGTGPMAQLVSDGQGSLIGVTSSGGPLGEGTIFKVNTATGAVTTAVQFTGKDGAVQGRNTLAGLTPDGIGGFWGLSDSGGPNMLGTIYRFGADGSFQHFFNFTGTSGEYPGSDPSYMGMVRTADGHLVGTTRGGGVTPDGAPADKGGIFRLHFGPSPATGDAGDVTAISATIRGTVRPNGAATTVAFEYATDPAQLAANNSATGSIPAAGSLTPFSKALTGLIPGTRYYYRIVGTSPENPNPQRGATSTFTTSPNTPPVVTLAGPATLVVEAAAAYQDAGATVSDAEEMGLMAGITANNVMPNKPGNYTVTWGVTDTWGLSGTASRTVQIVDTTAPALEPHQDLIVEATGPQGAVVAYAPASASDIVSVSALNYSQNSGTVFPIGTTTVTMTALDAANNSTSGTFKVIVQDTTKPTLSGPFAPLGLTTGADGTAALPNYVPQAVSGDAVGVASVVQNPPAGSARLAGTTTVTVTASDAAGNSQSVTFGVAVADGTPPAIAAPAGGFTPLTLVLDAQGQAALPNYAGQAVTSDNVGVTSITQSPAAGTKRQIGVTAVTVTAHDLAGNQASVSFNVTLIDTTPPSIAAPAGDFAPLALTTGADGTVALPDYRNQAVTSDNVAVAEVTQSPAPGSARLAGTTTVKLTVTDTSGNSTPLSFDVAVADGTAPALAPPEAGFAPRTLVLNANGLAALPDYTVQAVSSDNVGVTSTTQSPAIGALRPLGVTTVTVTAKDAAGNQTSVSFDVTMIDTTVPSIAAPEGNFTPLALITGEDSTVALPDYRGQAVTADNVEVANVTQSPSPGTARLAGTTQVTLTVTDTSGNANSTSFDVAVADGTKPEIAAPETGFAPLTIIAGEDGHAALPDYTAQSVTSDNVGVTSVTQLPAPGDARLFGKTVVTLTAHDAAGNTRSMSFDVTVKLDAPLVNSIAGRGGPVPAAGVDPRIPADATFTSVGLPTVGNARDLAFLGKWKSASGAGTGIFAGEPLALLAMVGDAASGISGVVYKTLQDPLIAPDGTVAFAATLKGQGVKAGNDFSVWASTEDGLKMLLREGTQAPGAPTGLLLKSVSGLSLRNGALLAVGKLALARGAVTAADDSVLLSVNAEGEKVLFREGQPVDLQDGLGASPIKMIETLLPAEGSSAHGRWQADGGAIARLTLADKRVVITQRLADDSFFHRLAVGASALDGAATWKALGLPAVEPNGDSVVVKSQLKAQLTAGQLPAVTSKNDTVLAFDPANATGFQTFAREGEVAPDTGGASYASFLDPVVNDARKVLFQATLAGAGVTAKNKTALFWGDREAPRLLARSGSAAPDPAGNPTGASWSKFTSYALPSGPNAGPVFMAKVSGLGVTAKNNVGLWAVDSTGVLRQLLRTGDIIDGQAVTGIHALTGVAGSLGASRGFNERGTVITRVSLAKGGQTILRIDIPDGEVRITSDAE